MSELPRQWTNIFQGQHNDMLLGHVLFQVTGVGILRRLNSSPPEDLLLNPKRMIGCPRSLTGEYFGAPRPQGALLWAISLVGRLPWVHHCRLWDPPLLSPLHPLGAPRALRPVLRHLG